MLDDYQLLEMEVEATNPVNAGGCFTSEKSPRLFLGQTRDGNVRRYRQDVPERIKNELDEAIDGEPVVQDLRVGLTHLEKYQRILGKQEPVQQVSRGFGYKYPDNLQRYQDVVRVTQDNVHLGAETFPWLLEELQQSQPCVAAIQDDRFVSLCHSPYISTKAHIAGIDTLEGYRRRGYAVAVAVEWGWAVRELGKIPIYSTGIDNVASQGVAAKVGLLHYNSDHHFMSCAAMEYKQLGNIGHKISEIGLGTSKYTGGPGPLRKGIELGASHIDTTEDNETEDQVVRPLPGCATALLSQRRCFPTTSVTRMCSKRLRTASSSCPPTTSTCRIAGLRDGDLPRTT